jgi:arylformamidase
MDVYLNYDQATLDRLLEPRSTAPDAGAAQERTADLCAAALSDLPHLTNVTYGAGAEDRLDIFPAPSATAAPVLIFCHGGGWQRGAKENCALLAPALTRAGVTLVGLDFASAPAQSIAAMVAQIRRAIAWVHTNASSFGADPSALHIGGHSSGAHLAAMMLTDGWQTELHLPREVVRSAVLVSGLYDLEPVRLSYRNANLGLDPAAARALSPLLHLGHPRPVTCIYGTGETAEFRRQSEAFAAAAATAGYAAASFALSNYHHFDVMLALAHGDLAAMRYVLEQLLGSCWD